MDDSLAKREAIWRSKVDVVRSSEKTSSFNVALEIAVRWEREGVVIASAVLNQFGRNLEDV